MATGIDPVTTLQNTTYTSAPKGSGGGSLGQVDFMKLIIAQMKNQNPLDPQKDTDFMAQMAQFESLNQAKATATSVKTMQGMQELTTAAGLIGKNVIGTQVDATSITRDTVGRALFGTPYAKLTSQQQLQVNNDDRTRAAIADAKNAGAEVSGKVTKVSVGADGIPNLYVNGKV